VLHAPRGGSPEDVPPRLQPRGSILSRLAALLVIAFGFLPIVNWIPGGRVAPWYGPLLRDWVLGSIIAIGGGVVLAILTKGWSPELARVEAWAHERVAAPGRTGVAFFVLSLALYALIARTVFSGVPLHLDELAQVVQARIFAEGRLFLEAGPYPEFRSALHIVDDNGTELPAGRAGNFGVCSSFSFFIAHHMSTIEGGMACTSDPEVGEMLRIVRANGWDRNLEPGQQAKWRGRFGVENDFEAKYTFYDLGYNLRPTEITGFIGLHQLRYVEETFALRERHYIQLEKTVKSNPDLVALRRDHIKVLSSFAFPIVCRDHSTRARYVKRFLDAGVEVRPLIAGNMQRQPFYKKYVPNSKDLPGADRLHDCAFYCANEPAMVEADLQVIEQCLRS